MAYYFPQSQPPNESLSEGDYIVKDGDCVESLAFEQGHLWATIWNHPRNASLKSARVSRNILLPGDRLYIPPRELKTVDCATDTKHTFVLAEAVCKFRLCLLQSGKPRTNEQYRLVVADKVFTGTTDSEGWIDVAIPPGAKFGELTIGHDPIHQEVYSVELGGMDPITEPSGIQKRLRNLGFHCEITGKMDEPTRTALALFQKGEDFDPSGDPDQDTLKKLTNRYGS